MKVLVITTMFPRPDDPVFGVFVQRRLAAVSKHCQLDVLSPVPFFPGAAQLFPRRYGHRRSIPRRATIHGLEVAYPRFFSIPRFFRPLDGVFLFLSVWWFLRRAKNRDYDLIDCQLVFAEGFAGRLLSRVLNVPYVITLRGHDINDTPRHPVRRRQIRWALRGAARVMGVAKALVDEAVKLGLRAERGLAIPNAVDAQLFHAEDADEARARLGLPATGPIVLSVGHLVERKGWHLVLGALAIMRDAGQTSLPHYVLVGGGSEEGDYEAFLRRRIEALDLTASVTLVGPVPNDQLRWYYSAATVSCLASSKEGWANVLLESLACGTPVVATAVWGTPEVIQEPAYGVLAERTAEDLARALTAALDREWDRAALADYARGHNWERVGRDVAEVYEQALT